MNRGANIFDFLETRQIPYHVSNPGKPEDENLNDVLAEVRRESIDFAFIYWPDLDGLMHMVGNRSAEVPAKLRVYEQRLERLLTHAKEHYQEVRLYIFSDHGMANCTEFIDLRSKIDALQLEMGRDYVVVYDSTMARFWFHNPRAKEMIVERLGQIPQGRVVPDSELERLQALFPDRYFGELIFLVKEGVLIVPSHMGERPIRAMHGYHPEEPNSYAALLSNRSDISPEITAIPNIYNLMTVDAELAHRANARPISADELLTLNAARVAQYATF